MSISPNNWFEQLFGTQGYAFADDLRPISNPTIAQLQAQANMAQDKSPFDWSVFQNYRPPVFVPEGWADWYACGDNLH